jgi:hypothetical protein
MYVHCILVWLLIPWVDLLILQLIRKWVQSRRGRGGSQAFGTEGGGEHRRGGEKIGTREVQREVERKEEGKERREKGEGRGENRNERGSKEGERKVE